MNIADVQKKQIKKFLKSNKKAIESLFYDKDETPLYVYYLLMANTGHQIQICLRNKLKKEKMSFKF